MYLRTSKKKKYCPVSKKKREKDEKPNFCLYKKTHRIKVTISYSIY